MSTDILFNLAALVAFCVFSTFFMDRWPLGRSVSLWVQGGLFGLIAIVGMTFPAVVEPGFIFDGRSVVLGLAAWHFGWRASVVSIIMAIFYRFHLGGPGVLPGTISICSSSLIGLLFRKWINPEKEEVHLSHTILLGYAVHLCIVFITAFLINTSNAELIAKGYIVPLLTAFPIATILASRILADYQSKKRVESYVALNEDMIRSIFDDSPLIVLLLDPISKAILDANDTALDYYGHNKGALQHLTLKDLEVKQSVGMRDVINVMGSIPQPFHHVRHRLASGDIRDVDVSYGTAYFEGNEVELMFVVDITEQIQFIESTHEALVEKDEILQTAMDGFWITDDLFIIQEVNEAYCSISGYLPEEIIGESLNKFDCQKFSESFEEEIRTCKTLRFETRHKTKDGQLLTLDVSLRRKPTPDGNLYYIFFRDITEEKKAQQRMRLLGTCLSSAANSVIITNAERKIEWVNKAFTQLSGYTLDDAYGNTTADLLSSGEHSEEFLEELNHTIQSGNSWHGEITHRHKNGTFYTVDATITPMKDEQGVISHFIGIHQDISEKRELEKLYLRSQRLETVGRLTSGIAHDLNNILSPIMMSAEMLQTTLKDSEEASMAEVILKSADRGSELLHQLLGFARGTPAAKQVVSPGPIIKESFKLYQETFPKNIEMKVEIPSDLPPVSIDPGQITQVLGNLIVNAKDAMNEGGTLSIEASQETLGKEWVRKHVFAREGAFLRIRVADTGTGIEPHNQEKILEPFFSTKPKGEGTGLGLSTCLNIVKGHDGFMDIQSEIGKGTLIDIFLPVTDESETQQAENQMPSSLPKSGNGKKILLVDDEEAIRTLVGTALESLSYKVILCNDGTEALERIDENPDLDLILLDFEMPNMNGHHVVSHMDQQDLTIPVVFITGMQGEQKEKNDDFLGRPVLFKPFSLKELQQTVETHLKTSSA